MNHLRTIALATLGLIGFCIAGGVGELVLGGEADTISNGLYLALIAISLPVIVYTRIRSTNAKDATIQRESPERWSQRVVAFGALLAVIGTALMMGLAHRVGGGRLLIGVSAILASFGALYVFDRAWLSSSAKRATKKP